MRTKPTIFRGLILVMMVLPVCSCRGGSAGSGSSSDEASSKKHPLKMNFAPGLQAEWRRQEAEEKERRQRDVVKQRMSEPELPDAIDPLRGHFTLDMALSGMKGSGDLAAVIDTEKGSIRCTLFSDKAPDTVANFVGLARGVRPWWDVISKDWVRRPFYESKVFTMVIPGVMVRGGCPWGNGMGAPGYSITPESSGLLKHDRPGLISMVYDSIPFGRGGQFTILARPMPVLDGKDVVFGECSPMEVIRDLASVPVDKLFHPQQQLRLFGITISRSGS